MKTRLISLACILLFSAGQAYAQQAGVRNSTGFTDNIGHQVTNSVFFTTTFPVLTGTGVTTALDISQQITPKHSVQVIVTGSPSACSLQLEGSLDSTNWFNLSGGQTCTSDILFSVVNKPVAFIRANLTTFTGGTNATVTYFGVK